MGCQPQGSGAQQAGVGGWGGGGGAQQRPLAAPHTLSRMMSISEYFMPFTRMGISLQEQESAWREPL